MTELADYNGYSGKERMTKYYDMQRRIASRELQPKGSCEICGDSGEDLEYHEEDYSKPYSWVKPEAYIVCKHCHIQKIRKRFQYPDRWKAFLAHARRGGHASDLYGKTANPELRREFEACCEAIKVGRTYVFRPLRNYSQDAGNEWFANLSLDQEAMKNRASRPRP